MKSFDSGHVAELLVSRADLFYLHSETTVMRNHGGQAGNTLGVSDGC
ncbi:MAG TPA: hypothetical protein VJ783_13565 [Pirellulales bacterium]|nr:hypothetical protein [Pirellulales bacterium]